MAFDTASLPLSYKTAQGRLRSSLLSAGPVRDAIVTEARQLGHHFKEAIVQEGGHGSSWRLTSDEGAHLNGTDLAPTPLGYFNAGLQADLAGRVGNVLRKRGMQVAGFGAGFSARYALTGSFSEGSGQGFAESVGGHIAFECDLPDADLAAVVRDAVARSPALRLVETPVENTFALNCNGRRRHAQRLHASKMPTPADPFFKYRKPPAPLEETAAAAGLGERIAKTGHKTPGTPAPALALGQRTTWSVNGEGMFDVARGIYRCKTALDRPGSSQFAFVTDETSADRAPCGLSLVSAAIAFCYMTQLARYIDAMKLDIDGVRLVQTSPYEIEVRSRGIARPCDTHLFLNGTADEQVFEQLQLVAANTCYLHQTMAAATPLKVTAANRGHRIL